MGKRLVVLMIFLDMPLILMNYCLVWEGGAMEAYAWLAAMLLLPMLIVGYNFWRHKWAKALATLGAVLFLLAGSVAIYDVRLALATEAQVIPERQTQVSSRYVSLGTFDHAQERLEEDLRKRMEESGRRMYQRMAEELRWETLPNLRPELLEREMLLASAGEFAGLLDREKPEMGYKVTTRQKLPIWKPFDQFRQFMQGFVDMPERQEEYERQRRQELELQLRNAELLGGLTFTEAEQIYQLQLAAALWPEAGEGWLEQQLGALGYDTEVLQLREAACLAEPARQSVWQLVDEEAELLGESYPGLYQAELVRWEPREGQTLPQGAIAQLMQGEEPEGVRPVERLRILFHMDRNDPYQGRYYTNARYIAVLHEAI